MKQNFTGRTDEDMNKPKYHVASFSGGKDSTAMTLHLIELGYPLDEVVCCDTTMELPAMYRHIEKVKQIVETAGIKFTILKSEHDFEYYLAQVDVPNRKPTSEHFGVPGYGWPSIKIRWCTKHLKIEPFDRYFEKLQEDYEVIRYIGIAEDEDYRLDRKSNQDPNHRHPLREWGWDENTALRYCYERGYDWEGLYEIFKNEKTGRARLSCYCCPLSDYDSLRKIRRHFPDLWGNMLDMDRKQWQTFSHGYSVADLEQRFALEDELTEAGHSIKNRQFFNDLKRLLADEVTAEEILEERETKVCTTK